MKKDLILVFIAIMLSSVVVKGQSNSFRALKNNFIDRPDVHSFSVNGFFCRMVLGMAGEWEFKEAIEDVQQVRLITIPAKEFKVQGLSVRGFKKLLVKDSFEELASIRDHGDDITFYLQSTGKKNRYVILIQEPDEVVVVELKGSIDVNLLMEKNNTLSLKNQ